MGWSSRAPAIPLHSFSCTLGTLFPISNNSLFPGLFLFLLSMQCYIYSFKKNFINYLLSARYYSRYWGCHVNKEVPNPTKLTFWWWETEKQTIFQRATGQQVRVVWKSGKTLWSLRTRQAVGTQGKKGQHKLRPGGWQNEGSTAREVHRRGAWGSCSRQDTWTAFYF